METLKVILIVLHLLVALGLIVVVLFQSSKSQGLSGTIAGGAETFFGKNKGKTIDGLLAKLTVVLAIVFIITSVSLTLVNKALDNGAAVDQQQEVVTTPAPEEVEATQAPEAEVTPEAEVQE